MNTYYFTIDILKHERHRDWQRIRAVSLAEAMEIFMSSRLSPVVVLVEGYSESVLHERRLEVETRQVCIYREVKGE